MGANHSYLTVTDQFCGAGGSSQGVRRFAERSKLGNGIEVKLALNHWKLAIETHATNFPEAAHHCTDIQACDPRSFPSTDILITSPECTNHSVAKGRKQVKAQLDAFAKGTQDPAAERSRATMWDVVRFAEHHRYRIVITENVVDARAWVCWDAWLLAMHNLGYRHQCVFFNSMFAWPTPQSRDRMYVVFWRKGQPRPNLDFRPWAPCPQCGPVQATQRFKPKASVKAKYGTQYTYGCPTCGAQVMPFYYAAINAIDWSVPAQRIGDRKEPLKERTMQRIAYGLKKYGNRPLSVSTLYGERLACRVKDAAASPLFTQTGNGATAVASPFMVDTKYSHAGEARAKGADAPLRAQTGQDCVGAVLPFTLSLNYPGQRAVPTDEAMRTVTGTRPEAVVFGAAEVPSALMVDTNYFTDHNKPLDRPLPAQTGANKLGIAFLAKLRGTDATALKGTAIGMDEPMGTLSAGGMHHALVSGAAMGFLQSYYGQATDAGLDEAMGALSTRDRHALVVGPPRVEDLYFRMLKAHEVQAGMAFARDYVVLGNQRDQVKQLGNAVTPPVMEMLVERCVESLM
jgi:DNA (cytosine-5)-methyltransferase 1